MTDRKYILSCEGNDFSFELPLSGEFDSEYDMISQLKQYDYSEVLYDFISDIWYSASLGCCGIFNLDKQIGNVIADYKTSLESIINNSTIQLSAYDADDNKEMDIEVNLNQVLLNQAIDIIEAYSNDEAYHALVANLIEDSLYEFEHTASWHIGCFENNSFLFEFYPTESKQYILPDKYSIGIWYGLNNESNIDAWTITQTMERFNVAFWFADNPANISDAILMNLIEDYDADNYGDPDWSMLWYANSLRSDVPDFSAIRKSCPIELCIDDTAHTISTKLEELKITMLKQDRSHL